VKSSILNILINLRLKYSWHKRKWLKKLFKNYESKKVNQLYVPIEVQKALKFLQMPEKGDISSFWFDNRDEIMRQYFKNRKNDELMAFEATHRWLTPIGKVCYQSLLVFIKNTKAHDFYGDTINKYRHRVRQISFEKFEFEFEGNMYNLATFNRYLKLAYNDNRNDLSGIQLNGVELNSVYIHDVNFSYAKLNFCKFRYCWLSTLNLDLTHLNSCIFEGSEMQGRFSLRFTDFSGTQFSHVQLGENFCDRMIKFNNVPYWYLFVCVIDRLRNSFEHDIIFSHGFRVFKHTSFLGCDTSALTAQEHKFFKSYVDWYQYTMFQFGAGYRNKSRTEKFLFLSSIVATKSWSSYKVLGIFGSIVSLVFASIFYLMPVGSFNHFDESFFTAIYYSVVTFTTLGYGDITPVTWYAKLAVIIEVIVGYITLGSFVFIIGHKVSDRY
jgi:hypothetical protein